MKIYVAGKWAPTAAGMEPIRAAQRAVLAAGHTVTHDWTSVEGTTDQTGWDAATRRAFRAKCAALDIDGVRTADAVVALMTDTAYSYRGTFTELGAALGLGKRVLVVTPAALRLSSGSDAPALTAATNCFYEHPSVEHVETVEEALSRLVKT